MILKHFQENYLGEHQVFTDFYDTPKEENMGEAAIGPFIGDEVEVKPFDARDYRPFAVTVSLAIHDIHGHLIKVILDNYMFTFFPHISVEKLQKMKESHSLDI